MLNFTIFYVAHNDEYQSGGECREHSSEMATALHGVAR